jgi:hypothetical protein
VPVIVRAGLVAAGCSGASETADSPAATARQPDHRPLADLALLAGEVVALVR